MTGIRLYGLESCSACKAGRAFLAQHAVQYEYLDARAARLKGSVPLLEVPGKQPVVGYEEGEWARLLRPYFNTLAPSGAVAAPETIELDAPQLGFEATGPGVWVAFHQFKGSDPALRTYVVESLLAGLYAPSSVEARRIQVGSEVFFMARFRPITGKTSTQVFADLQKRLVGLGMAPVR